MRDYGAVGDGVTLDTAAIQRAVDEAAAGGGAQVLVRRGRKYLIGTLELKGGIDFHLADDAELLVSTKPEHFTGGAVIAAREARSLRITGTGNIHGRAREFMTGFDQEHEWWLPAAFRPKIFVLRACQGLEIRNCHIVCGDDAIVVKATRQGAEYGPSANITVQDCVIETQDSGAKIGTETTADIHDIRFERCEIRSSCRGPTIQLHDEADVYNIDFRDIKSVSRYHSDPWWGRGEAISLTAIPRTPRTKVGKIHDVRIRNVSGRAENSVRVSGVAESRIRDVRLEDVAVTLDRWTKDPGGLFDNRPTTAQPGIEPHGNPGFSIRYADRVTLEHCSVAWGANRPDYFTNALEVEQATGLALNAFTGEAAHPERELPAFCYARKHHVSQERRQSALRQRTKAQDRQARANSKADQARPRAKQRQLGRARLLLA